MPQKKKMSPPPPVPSFLHPALLPSSNQGLFPQRSRRRGKDETEDPYLDYFRDQAHKQAPMEHRQIRQESIRINGPRNQEGMSKRRIANVESSEKSRVFKGVLVGKYEMQIEALQIHNTEETAKVQHWKVENEKFRQAIESFVQTTPIHDNITHSISPVPDVAVLVSPEHPAMAPPYQVEAQDEILPNEEQPTQHTSWMAPNISQSIDPTSYCMLHNLGHIAPNLALDVPLSYSSEISRHLPRGELMADDMGHRAHMVTATNTPRNGAADLSVLVSIPVQPANGHPSLQEDSSLSPRLPVCPISMEWPAMSHGSHAGPHSSHDMGDMVMVSPDGEIAMPAGATSFSSEITAHSQMGNRPRVLYQEEEAFPLQ